VFLAAGIIVEPTLLWRYKALVVLVLLIQKELSSPSVVVRIGSSSLPMRYSTSIFIAYSESGNIKDLCLDTMTKHG